jgi:hypothetical protein
LKKNLFAIGLFVALSSRTVLFAAANRVVFEAMRPKRDAPKRERIGYARRRCLRAPELSHRAWL